MKKMFLLCLVLTGLLCYSQQETDLPDFTPPSPEAAAITQYGNQEINESSGKFTTSIPLYTYSAGKLQVPISLNYMGNGVKVNDLATWTGMNWTLNAGGVITRTVNHRADEKATNRIFQNDIDDQAFSALNNNTAFVDLFLNSSDDYYDSEPDIFNFSFGGYSGSFYLHDVDSNPNSTYQDYQPVLITGDSEISITIEGNSNNTNKYNLFTYNKFKITTPDGVEYFFGGNDGTEESFMDQDWHIITTPQAITSFYLTEIKHPISGHVFLDYLSGVNYKIAAYANRVLKKYGKHPDLVFTPPVVGECMNGGSSGDEIYFAREASKTIANPTIVYNNIRNGKFLSRIYSLNNNIEVNFNSSNTVDGGFNFERVLNSIDVISTINNSNNLISEIELDYNYFDNSSIYAQRFFLDKISFNKDLDEDGISNSNDYKLYTFKYNDAISLPARFSSSQDGMGYFNGKSNQNGLLPSINVDEYPEIYKSDLLYILSGGSFTADRSTDFNYKSKGALEKIYYPTKGHTLIEYESPYNRETTLKNVHRKTFLNNYPLHGGNGATHNDVPINTVFIGSISESNPDGTSSTNSLFESGMIDINIELETTEHIGHQRTYLRITNITDDVVEDLQPYVMPNPGDGLILNATYSKYFLKNKDYKIELILPGADPNVPVTTTIDPATSMRGLMYFKYKTGYQLKQGEGLRVKRISDFTKNGRPVAQNIKRYYYTKAKDVFVNPIEAETTVRYIKPEYFKEVGLLVDTYSLHPVAGCNGWGLTPHAYITESSPSRGYLFDIYPVNNYYKQSILQDYKNVTISYGGDNFENGGKEKVFKSEISHNVSDSSPTLIGTVDIENKQMSQFSKGHLRLGHNKPFKESTFKRKGDTLKLINKIDYVEYLDRTLNIQEVILASIYSDIAPGPTYSYENTWFGNYYIVSKDYSIKKTKNTNYIDAVPVVWPGGNQPVPNNPYLYQGWMPQDHDNDGITNYDDDDYQFLIDNWDPSDSIDESAYRKIITTTEYEYDGSYAGQPTKIITTTSDDNKDYETVNRYLDDVNSLTNIDAVDITNYDALAAAHRIGSPVQTESYIKKEGNLTLLSKNRTLYSNDSGKLLPSKIQAAKGTNSLEDRIEFVNYDVNGNPTEVKKTDGSITKYAYNGLGQVTSKIENYQMPNISIGSEDYNNQSQQSFCNAIQLAFPNSQVSYYYYDSVTNLLTKIFNANCQTMYYEYDDQHRLKYVKDKDGNILSKNEYNYTNQN